MSDKLIVDIRTPKARMEAALKALEQLAKSSGQYVDNILLLIDICKIDMVNQETADNARNNAIARLRDTVDFYQKCGFVIIEKREDDGRMSKFVEHAGVEHYPARDE